MRLIVLAKYNEHTAPIFKRLKILPFDKIIYEQNLKFMHSIYNKYAPPSFDGVWSLKSNNAEHTLRNTNDFVVIAPRFEGYKKFPLYSFSKKWNESSELRLYNNKTTFSIALREKLLSELCPEEQC